MQHRQPITGKYAYQRIQRYLSSISDKEDRKPVLYIANYQSIRDLQIIELNKITLLFGPNSSGKSAILDAIMDFTKMLGSMRLMERLNLERKILISRMHWESRDNDNESLVIGFGGIQINWSAKTNSDPAGCSKIYSELSNLIPGEYIDIVFMLGGDGFYYSFWKGEELIFQKPNKYEQRNQYLLYGNSQFKSFLLENDDKFLQLESTKLDFRFDPRNPHRLPLRFCIDKTECHVNNIKRNVPTPPLTLGDSMIDFHGIRDISHGMASNSNLGKVVSFFLNNQPEHFCNQLKRISRLGPLRSLPCETDLTFEFEGGMMVDSFRDGFIDRPPDPQSGMEYWKTLADQINNNLVEPSKYDVEVLDRVNSWLSGAQRFNTGFSITYKNSAILPIPLPEEIDNIDWKGGLRLVSLSLFSSHNEGQVGLEDVGTGISQLIPVIVACELDLPLAIEQPELHLHPGHQLLIGDLLISRSNRLERRYGKYNRAFDTLPTCSYLRHGLWTIVETHSEHLILRILRRIRESSSSEIKHRNYHITEDDVSVYYFNTTNDGTTIEHLRINQDGDFIDEWPKGFFNERDEELFF